MADQLASNYNVENPQIQFQGVPTTFNQGQLMINAAQSINQSLDSVFNNQIRQKLANSAIAAQNQQMQQQQQEMAQQRGQNYLQSTALGGPDVQQLGQNLMQGQQAGQPPQGGQPSAPQAGASSGPFDPTNANGVTHEQIQDHMNMLRAQYQMSIAGQSADIQKKQASAQAAQQMANYQGQQLGGGQQGQSAQVPTQSDTSGNQYIVNPSAPDMPSVNYEKTEAKPSMSIGGSNIPLKPGEKYEAPPPADVSAANGIVRAQSVSDQLFNAYQKLAAQGKVGKLAGTWDSKVGQFTGGAKSPDAVAFQNMAQGLVGTLKMATDQNRLSPEILDRMDNLLADPTASPSAVKQTKQALDYALKQALTIHTASYPTEAARLSRVKQALSQQSTQANAAPPQKQGIAAQVGSKADYDNLPSGTPFIWNGQSLVKQ